MAELAAFQFCLYPQHHMDSAIGVHIIDRWTYYALEFLEKVTSSSKSTLADFVSLWQYWNGNPGMSVYPSGGVTVVCIV